MNKKNLFKGLGVALVTPFHADGSIDYDALGSLLDYHMQSGTDFLCVLGSTAETPCLTTKDKIEIKNFVVERLNGTMPILLGFGGNCTNALVEEARNFDFSGVDGILSVVPYYNKPSQEGIYRHYMVLSEALPDMPIVLYNVPGRTGINMLAETVIRVANAADNVVAIKEASGNIKQIEEIIKKSPKGFEVISGDDALTRRIIELGGVGVISVVGNAIAKEFSEMVHAALKGDFAEAENIDKSLAELYRLVFADGNPAGIKALMSHKGMCENILRLPLTCATSQTIEALKVFA